MKVFVVLLLGLAVPVVFGRKGLTLGLGAGQGADDSDEGKITYITTLPTSIQYKSY